MYSFCNPAPRFIPQHPAPFNASIPSWSSKMFFPPPTHGFSGIPRHPFLPFWTPNIFIPQPPHIFNMLAAQVRYMLCCDFLTVLNTCISPPQQHLGLRKWSLPSPGPAKSEAKRSKQTLRNRAISSSFKNLKKKIYHLRHNKLSIRCNRMETVEIATKVASYLAYFVAP